MKDFSYRPYRPTEKDVIDALLKISEIIQKSETIRQRDQSTNTNNKSSKKAIGDGDCTEICQHYEQQQQVPVPPPMRTMDSYVSGFNQKASNCNQTSTRKTRNGKRLFCDTSSDSSCDDQHRRKHSICQKSVQSTHDTNKPSSSSTMMPIASAPAIPSVSAAEDTARKDSSVNVDQQFQMTLEKYLKSQLLSSDNGDNTQSQKVQLSSSETKKLVNGLKISSSNSNYEYYEKQRELALLSAKEGNYNLSYSIYTNLLHDPQYDHKIKSDILSSRATILLLDHKCFESIIDCTQALAYNQWNKLAYIIRGACWMIEHEYTKAIDDYSKLFHFFDQSSSVLDLLNLAYKKSQLATMTHSHFYFN